MYYMNNIGVTKHQSQTAKVSVSNVGKNLDEIMTAITAAGLTKEESKAVLAKVLNHGATVEEAIAEVRPVEVVEEPVTEPKASEISKIRKAVATLANKINGKIKNLSKAFKKAWSVIKGQVIKSKVAGVSFNQKALQRLTRYNTQSVNVELVRESNNQYDENAVAVTVSVNSSNRVKIGFLPHELAKYISKVIDKGIVLTTQFKGVTGGTAQYESYGALIEIKAKGII